MRFWQFSEQQQADLATCYQTNGGAALEFHLAVPKAKKAPENPMGSIGFLYREDFASENKLRKERQKQPQVSANFVELSETGTISLVLCINREKELPVGFYVDAGAKYAILAARFTLPCIGFDYSGEIPRYAFAPNGGMVEPFSRTVDLSGVPQVFPAVNTAEALMPTLYVLAGAAPNADDSDIYANIGGERLTLRKTRNNATEAITTALPCAAFKSPFSTLSIAKNSELVYAAMIRASDKSLLITSQQYPKAVLKPVYVDPGLIMEWRRDNWRGRDYELFAWDRFPHVLIFDTLNYAVQDDFFRRLAFFTEKAGYTGRLMSDSFLASQHGYNAHDYRAESLAAFFELARVTDFALNSRELLLKEILSANGIIRIASDGTVTAGTGAVISISQESPVYLRWTFIAHEGWHGIFFTDADFRNTVASLYYTVDQRALRALIRYFAVTPTLNYNTADDYLMKNEFMAYMLQRPLNQVREYYVNLAARPHAQQTMKQDADYILQTNADGYVSAATMLEQYVRDRWNLAAGRVWLINRQQVN